jgi:ribosomal-protein-alanine N-acetyltransferase
LFDVCGIMQKQATYKHPVIYTERLVLRALKKSDAKKIVELRSDEQVNRYLNRAPKINKAEATIFIKNIQNGNKDNEWFYWAIALKNEDELIGTICLWNFNAEKSQADTGYELHPAWQGKGLMREALAAVIAFGFNDLKLRQIEAITNRYNSPSLALLANTGFKEEKGLSDEFERGEITSDEIRLHLKADL